MSQADRDGAEQSRTNVLRSPMFTATWRFLLLLLIIYFMMLTPLTWFQRSLIYHPHPTGPLLASHSGLPQAVVDVTVKSDDGLDLHGWLAVAGTTSTADPIDASRIALDDRPVVLYFPGNAGNRSKRSLQMAIMGSLNAHVLLVDYRGYGDNPGKPTELHLARDARSAWNYLTRELRISPRRIVIYGESLGGGVATRLASDVCQERIEPGGLILQSTFNSLVAVAQYHFPILPVSLVLVDRFRSDVRIPQVTCPILQIHGKLDSIVPFQFGQRLFDAAPIASSSGIAKRQLVLPLVDHNDVYSDTLDGYSPLVAELERFLTSVASAPEPEAKSIPAASSPTTKPPMNRGVIVSVDWTIVISMLIVLLAVVAGWAYRRQ